jgi:hypothetical protein
LGGRLNRVERHAARVRHSRSSIVRGRDGRG